MRGKKNDDLLKAEFLLPRANIILAAVTVLHWARSQVPWFPDPPLSLTGCVIFAKSFKVYVPGFGFYK